MMKKLPSTNHNRVPLGSRTKAQWALMTEDYHQATVAGVIHIEVSRPLDRATWDLKVYAPDGGEATERTGIINLNTAKIIAEIIAASDALKICRRLKNFYDRRSFGTIG